MTEGYNTASKEGYSAEERADDTSGGSTCMLQGLSKFYNPFCSIKRKTKRNGQSSVKSVKAKNNVKTSAKSVNKVKNSADIQSTKETSCSTSMPSSDNVLIYKEKEHFPGSLRLN